MCIRKWWQSIFGGAEITPPIVTGNKVALLFAIGDYQGSQNDLTGPPYDEKNVLDFVADKYPDFVINKYLNSQVTRANFENAIKGQLAVMKSGDTLLIYYSGHGTNGYDPEEPDNNREGLYLYDGTYWDDQFTTILQGIPAGVKVIIVLDSCFAHGSTTPKNSICKKARFVKTEDAPPKKIKVILKSDTMNYIVIAACQENQTSADIGPNGGAFTYYWLRAWNRDYTYKQWTDKTAELIAATHEYDQVPNIEGDAVLMNEQIFAS